MTPAFNSRHDRLVRRLGSTGWLYLSTALPWIILFVVLRMAWHSELLVRPTDLIPLAGATLACAHRHDTVRRQRSSHPPGA